MTGSVTESTSHNPGMPHKAKCNPSTKSGKLFKLINIKLDLFGDKFC